MDLFPAVELSHLATGTLVKSLKDDIRAGDGGAPFENKALRRYLPDPSSAEWAMLEGLAITVTSALAISDKAAPIVQAFDSPATNQRLSNVATSPSHAYDSASPPLTHPPQPDGRHEIRFTLLGCAAQVRPKISGTSGSQGQFTPSPPGSIIVPTDFIGSVYLTGEDCGKYGDSCQSVDLTFMPNPSATVKSYINFDAMYGKKFLFPAKARFDDNKDTSDAATIDCSSYDCIDGSRDPDDFITNRIVSSTKGVGVDIVYDCSANTTSTTY